MPIEDPESLPSQCPACLVCDGAPVQGKVKPHIQPTSSQKADPQDLKNMEQRATGTEDVFCKQDFMLAPSSFACEFDSHVEPDKLADIYTGQTHISLPASISQAGCLSFVCVSPSAKAVCCPASVHACLSPSVRPSVCLSVCLPLSLCVAAKAVCPLCSLFGCLVM